MWNLIYFWVPYKLGVSDVRSLGLIPQNFSHLHLFSCSPAYLIATSRPSSCCCDRCKWTSLSFNLGQRHSYDSCAMPKEARQEDCLGAGCFLLYHGRPDVPADTKVEDWAKISVDSPTQNIHRQHHDWDNDTNQAFKKAEIALCKVIELEKVFPPCLETTKISICKQKDSECV